MVDSRELDAPWSLAQNRFYGSMNEHGVWDKKIALPSFCSDGTRHSLRSSVDSNNFLMFNGVQLVGRNTSIAYPQDVGGHSHFCTKCRTLESQSGTEMKEHGIK